MQTHKRQSPRKRFTVVLPEEPQPRLGGALAQLALLVVMVNVCACLLAGELTRGQPAAPRDMGETANAEPRPAADHSVGGRLAKLLFRQ